MNPTSQANMTSPSRNNLLAILAIIAGAILAIGAVVFSIKYSGTSELGKNTGTLGDTIGGIAGPILNFFGLIIIYLSLKEQFNSNELQRINTNTTENREELSKNFGITLNLIDRLTNQARFQNEQIRTLRSEHIKAAGAFNESHVREYMARVFPLLVMFSTIQQIVRRAGFDRFQEQAIAFILLNEYAPNLQVAEMYLKNDSPLVGVDTMILDGTSIKIMRERMSNQLTWTRSLRLLSDNILNQED